MKQARRHRLTIGLIAVYALLLSALLPSFAVADPLQDYLAAHLCAPSGDPQDGNAPIDHAEHQQKCQMCGPGCAMGGFAPAATLADGAIAITPRTASDATPVRRAVDIPALNARYPSDTLSQGPPQAA